jgi:hypothetical protein
MRQEFVFLSTVILGMSSPGRNIDVCLQPLIDELTQLWSSGALTYDISRKHNFIMRAGLMWIINDFSALWNGFWLEHAWKTSMSILHGKQQGINANKWR